MALRFPVEPMKAAIGALPPTSQDDQWAYEIKWDGYRTLAFVDDGAVKLQSSSGLDVTGKYPELDGFALVRTLRGRGDALPILVLTARDDEIDEALGLELGADDYVTKPFSNRVLISRVAALLRRQAIRGGAPVEPIR